ncbi:uncharacterized protein PV09_08515 [Verruconis gallopava]|uniref:MARVEL domain-containing protein n=1 Tax=Verruconis gallopava TaxID=253628 RepID=A0A0D1YGC5_9PEZI|nr:uncharacterized protein PV09_08515 [Verruconis gallopava]KIV99846.1 hypothetical protein PV09_08515 [Verruconis gallopava]
MARSYVSERVVVRERYFWPPIQLNFWTIIILVAGSLELGVFAQFIQIQQRLDLGIPWLFPYGVTVGSLVVFLVILEIIMIAQNRLLPGVMMLASFALFVLFLTGVIETAIQLFGAGDVSSNCQNYVTNNPVRGLSVDTLAWLQQSSICSSWYAAFAFWVIGSVFFVWMFIMAAAVGRGVYEPVR